MDSSLIWNPIKLLGDEIKILEKQSKELEFRDEVLESHVDDDIQSSDLKPLNR